MAAPTEQPASAKKALATLEEVLRMPPRVVARDASIQRFEHTFEVCWKAIKAYLAEVELRMRYNGPMPTMREIEALGDRIGREFRPDRVVLFGSYAYGSPGPDSDVDLLVIMPHKGKPSAVATAIRSRVRPTFPLDIIVRAPDLLARRLALQDCFLREVVDRGRVLYERADD